MFLIYHRLNRNLLVRGNPPKTPGTLNPKPFNSEPGGEAVGLGFGVPHFNTFCLKGTLTKKKCILFSPWLLKSPGEGSLDLPTRRRLSLLASTLRVEAVGVYLLLLKS